MDSVDSGTATEVSPMSATSILPGKPGMAWLIWGGVTLVVAAGAGIIAWMSRGKKDKKEEGKTDEKPVITKE